MAELDRAPIVNRVSQLACNMHAGLSTLAVKLQGTGKMESIRRYAKTTMAWEALSRPDAVGRQAHTLLLMANGRRSERELSLLLGTDVSELAYGLMEKGYLLNTATSLQPEADDEITISV